MAIASNAKYNDKGYIGQRFGSLVVKDIKHEPTGKPYWWMWLCKCDCGKEKWMRPDFVSSGHSKTCGCGRRFSGAITHGESKTRLYMIWRRMVERCNPNIHYAKFSYRYAGRGIRVCDEWQDYVTFAAWAKANGYDDTKSIERIDNDGNYCPENCKWIERGKQARNRGTTFWVEYQGRRMSLAEACEIAGMPYKQVFARLKWNWPLEKALSIPINETRKWKRSERFCKTNQERR